ncbi:phosphatidylinositol 4-phosphate 5-kinase 6 [Phtheirospermum japonicum]|uniref:Phosphatidylinositol 4-phosphate 5-kinase 6 n=1 Tax=Phtheirospermum japonicum TaxID=374723 RepID=A0A830BBB6_9LAMI|nr:phosphatidylinositol 4-phosphate 5-kinase 6 [Phtheirospermum japonicum]
MDGQKSPAKLTRTHSSLLRSSPTMRSSIQSLSSVTETSPDQETLDLEEQKPHSKPSTPPVRSNASPVFSALFLSVYTLFAFFIWDDISTSENLLLSLIFVAGLLFLRLQEQGLINRTLGLCKQKLGLSVLHPRNRTKQVQCNGDVYEGEFHKGRCNGVGGIITVVNGRYEGDWVDGRYDGVWDRELGEGERYIGQYRQGLRHGYGSCGDGSCYVGEFKCGVKHGIGCYHFRNGDRYAGEYFGDKIHGFGVYHFGNGHCYEGSWHEGRKQGYGMYTFRNGETRCGEWDGGKLKTPLSPLTDSILRAVQAARKTAENAIHLRRVDEKVNKAVTAANRAATAARVAAVKAVQNRIHGKFCNINI